MKSTLHSASRRSHRALMLFAGGLLVCAFACKAEPANPGLATPASVLRFQDFFQSPVGPRGLEMTDLLRQANQQTVRLRGYL
ncbi:MAG: hypothetical protein ACR2I0_10830, partial [Rhodoferax sp.]